MRKTKSKTKKSGKARSQTRGGDTRGEKAESRGLVLYVSPAADSKIVTRKFGVNADISTTAGGVVILFSNTASGIITALGAEFTNFSQEFQSFRPTQIRSWWQPSTTSATSSTGPYQGGMIIAPWCQFPLTTLSNVAQSDKLIRLHTLETLLLHVGTAKFPNGKLWNQVGVALPADRDFGYSAVSTSTLAASSRLYSVFLELTCQFQRPQ